MGRVIPNASNTSFLSHVYTYGAELRLGHQTTGKHDWERLFNYPEYGLCLRYAHFDTTMFAETAALFGYYNGTIWRNHRWTFHYQFGVGVSYWSNPYNEVTNPGNRFIGSHLNAHIDLAVGIDCRIAPQVDLTLRANFSHSSNAAIKLPNMGINPLSGAVGVKCYLHKQDTLGFSWRRRDTSFVKKNSFYVMVSAGTRQSKKDAVVKNGAAGPYYLGTSLQIGYMRQPHPKFRRRRRHKLQRRAEPSSAGGTAAHGQVLQRGRLRRLRGAVRAGGAAPERSGLSTPRLRLLHSVLRAGGTACPVGQEPQPFRRGVRQGARRLRRLPRMELRVPFYFVRG